MRSRVKYFIDFISINGVYAITALFVLFFPGLESRYYTIPLRIVVALSIIQIIISKKYSPLRQSVIYIIYLWFIIFYWFKILLNSRQPDLHIPAYEYFMYSIIYCFLPFIYYSQRKQDGDMDRLFSAIFYSGMIFSIITIIMFFRILIMDGTFDRYKIGMDPLIISYTGSSIIGICLSKLVFGNEERKPLLLIGLIIGLCPFLIGGSRGPILTLSIPLIVALVFLYARRLKRKVITYLSIFFILFLITLTIFGDVAFSRLASISSDIEQHSGDARRLFIWEQAFSQFLEAPIFGDSIQIKGVDYPHNLSLEVLMSTGIAGFIPFITLLILGIYKSFKILKNSPNHAWIYMFFMQSVLMGMLSGNVYSDIWYWSGLAVVLSFDG